MAKYWQDRFVQLEKAQMNKGIEYYHELEKQYTKASQEVQKEIMSWYGRLAKNNEISISEARKLLSADELKEFKWTVEEYIEKGRQNNIDGSWIKELENASAKVHINRLEAMKIQMQQQVEMLYGNELDSFDAFMRDTYTEGFYRSAFEIQKGFGVGTNLAKLDTNLVDKIIAKPWAADGSNFSSRIWKQKAQLINDLQNGLTQAFARGMDPYALTKQISERFKVSKGQAGRLVMTETAFFHSAAQLDSFKELGVKEYEITAVLDNKTSKICQEMDGVHLPLSEFKAGITAPPFHCWCRTTTVPYFNDEFTLDETRISRGEDGKLYEVPYNMTYPEWKKAFVDGGSKEELKELLSDQDDGFKKKVRNAFDVLTRKDPPIKLSDLKGKFIDEINELLNGSPNKYKDLIIDNRRKILFAKTNCLGSSRYNKKYGIFVNLKYDSMNSKGKWTTFFHEVGHNIDEIFGHPSITNKNFGKLLRSDFEAFTDYYMSLYNISESEAYDTLILKLKKADIEESHIISDLFDALSNGKIYGGTGHAPDYWNDEKICKEAFAHFFSASALDNQKKLETIKSIFPKSYDEFEKMIGELHG